MSSGSSSPPLRDARARLSHFYGLDSGSSHVTTPSGHVTTPSGHVTTPKAEDTKPAVRRTSLKCAVRKLQPGAESGPLEPVKSPLDINSSSFDPDMFVSRLVTEASLSQLMAQEGEIVRQIQSLDSDMQTLVYENYNKFIAATETIRKMRVDFRSMEEEMSQLAASMTNITSFSAEISERLRTRRTSVARLSLSAATLQKLQFVLELPEKLKESISLGRAGQAVEDWGRAELALARYRDMPSFAGIQEDCQAIMQGLRKDLRGRLEDPSTSPLQLQEAVELLRLLGAGSEELCEAFLRHTSTAVTPHLEVLEVQAAVMAGTTEDPNTAVMDPLEFVDWGCNQFLAELSLASTSYSATFTNPGTGELEVGAGDRLHTWGDQLLTRYTTAMEQRLGEEARAQGDVALLVRALDRFHRRLAASARSLPGRMDLGGVGLAVVLSVASSYCGATAGSLAHQLTEVMVEARQAIAQPRRQGTDPPLHLTEVNQALLSAIADNVGHSLSLLRTFTDPELSFSGRAEFRDSMSRMVREDVLVAHLHRVLNTCRQFVRGRAVPPQLLLLLSRTAHDLHTSVTGHLAGLLCQEFPGPSPSLETVDCDLAEASQSLLHSYVQAQAADLSLMLRKSVEARDWLSTVEPRSVRAVMKRVVEDVTSVDDQVGQLYEEGQRKVRSSDSSRTFGARSRSAYSSYLSSTMDSSLASNIQKLFSEKVDYFAPVEPSKVSVLTAIIKLGLKTLLECVRLQTFARYGLQQIQVDCHYLQLYLWRFVSDEAVVHQLLEEVLGSALHRSLEQPPVLMEPSVVEVICDKGG